MKESQPRKPLSGLQAAAIAATMKWYTRLNVVVFRLSRGRWMNTFPGGFPICLVTVEGRKSKVKRDVPLLHLPFMEKKILLASQGGLPRNPAWYYNVVANPHIAVTVHGSTRNYRAVEMNQQEKQRYWPHIIAMYPDFARYAARTERDIPIFICSPGD